MCKTPAFLDGSLSLNFQHVLGYLFATSEEESLGVRLVVQARSFKLSQNCKLE